MDGFPLLVLRKALFSLGTTLRVLPILSGYTRRFCPKLKGYLFALPDTHVQYTQTGTICKSSLKIRLLQFVPLVPVDKPIRPSLSWFKHEIF